LSYEVKTANCGVTNRTKDGAKQLHSVVVQPAPLRSVNPAAHDAYLRGKFYWFAGDFDKSGPYFRRAVELQPDWALGWSGVAMYYGASAVEGTMSPEESIPQFEVASDKAVELDDSLPEAHLDRGVAHLVKWNWARAEQELARAIELNPGFGEAYFMQSRMFAALDRNQESIAAARKATELDPFARPFAMALAYICARQYDAAISDVRLRLEPLPRGVALHQMLFEAYRRKGAYKDALLELETISRQSGDEASAKNVQRAFQQGGYQAVLRHQVSDLKQWSLQHYVSPVDLACLNGQLGRREETLALLEEAYRQHAPGLLWVRSDPAFDFLHTDERYRAVIKGIGFPARE
jgi:tetratricopeptide (TPR) repeat protein